MVTHSEGVLASQMASYAEKDYEPIFLHSIRANVTVPFDCYLLLKENDRIVHFIKKGQQFPANELDRLKSLKFKGLYIHVSSRESYLSYLDAFLSTDEGKKALKSAFDKGSREAIRGIPLGLDVGRVLSPLQETPPATEGAGNTEAARAENEVLRVQLQDARALLEKGERKIAELKRMHAERDGYIGALEEEGAESRDQLRKAQERLTEAERENLRHSEHSAGLERLLSQKKDEEEAKHQSLLELRSRIVDLERNLRVFTAALEPEAVAVLRQKEGEIARMAEQLEKKAEENMELRKEAAKLRGFVQGAALLKRQMGAAMERACGEREMLSKSQEGLQRKAAMLQNLFDAERKAVAKLTAMIEDLRKERVEYMGRTAQALKDHKAMMGKAASLNGHVQAEAQRGKTLAEQNQSLLTKQKELLLEHARLRKRMKGMEAELGRASDLREENKRLQALRAAEQRETLELEKEIRALRYKLKNQKPAA